jgi:GNAT superfamily N-acetyltransferase
MGFSNTLPIGWNGKRHNLPKNIGAIFDLALVREDKPEDANTLVAFTANIGEGHQGRGLSSKLLQAVKALAADHGYRALIVPVRPVLKSRYPLIPMHRYAHWRREDGAPFDPWIRVHWRLGAEILKVEPNARPVSGTISQWEEWTGMRFPESGEYTVPGALRPVAIDRERDIGVYEEPAVWVKHTI